MGGALMSFLHFLLKAYLLLMMGILMVYGLRHYVFALARLFLPPREAYLEWAGMAKPMVTILVPMHNEERVCLGVLEALAQTTFDLACLQVIPVNDRSTDGTGPILDGFAKDHPWCQPFHRQDGMGGKAAALRDAMARVKGELLLLFDADYLPGVGLVESLIAPFGDPEIGAVMGRVVPQNGATNLLTRVLDMERSGGYQTNQEARWRLGLVPQFGGTVGGIRLSALEAIGGWDPYMLAEDTDLTFRLLALGWKVAYVNRAECYEEVVENWAARRKQVRRWALGHMQACLRHLRPLLANPNLGFWEKTDGLLLLGIYFVPPLTLLAWLISALLLLMDPTLFPATAALFLAVAVFSTAGNTAIFFEIGIAVALDGQSKRLRILPFIFGGVMSNLFTVTGAGFALLISRLLGKSHVAWDKTPRFR